MSSWGLHQYGKTFEAWPVSADGEKEAPAFLVHCSPLDMEAAMIQSMLEAYGIPSIQHYPGDGAFGKVMLGVSGNGTDIYVPQSLLADAQALLKGEPENDQLQE